MKTIKQLMRQPIKMLAGILIITLAVAVLCVCVGQSFAAKNTLEQLDDIFKTLALPALGYTKEADEWTHAYAKEHPDVVRSIGNPGLVAAYIPELTPDNYTGHLYLTKSQNLNFMLSPNMNESEYTSAMFEIRLTKADIPKQPQSTFVRIDGREYSYESQNVTVTLTGTIQKVIGLAEGFCDPTGFTASIRLVTTWDELKQLNLREGERYLVYTTDYWDNDWFLRSFLAQDVDGLEGELLEPFDPECMNVFSHEEIVEYNGSDSPNGYTQIVAKYHFKEKNLIHGMERWAMSHYRNVSFSIEDESAIVQYNVEVGPDGNVIAEPMDNFSIRNDDGESVMISAKEYHALYREPTIVRLEGSPEEFLESGEGELWQEALRNIEINSNAFPMIGVEGLDGIAEFARDWSRITEGRSFTEEELASGARVCILSDTLAELNGLSVGDTIRPQLYSNDSMLPYQINISEGPGSVNPVAYYYFEQTSNLEPEREYTIIGLYHQDAERGNVDNNLYAFTPNTIFVPKTSVPTEMEYGYTAFFRSFILENGEMETFAEAAAEAGVANQFFYDDNGYSAVGSGLNEYQDAAERAVIIAMVFYGIVLLLFLLLFPGQQGKVLKTMESLGADQRSRAGHVVKYGAGILLPGTALGIACGMMLWQQVVGLLSKEAGTAVNISMDIGTVVCIGTAQLFIALLFTCVAAMVLTKKKNLMKRK